MEHTPQAREKPPPGGHPGLPVLMVAFFGIVGLLETGGATLSAAVCGTATGVLLVAYPLSPVSHISFPQWSVGVLLTMTQIAGLASLAAGFHHTLPILLASGLAVLGGSLAVYSFWAWVSDKQSRAIRGWFILGSLVVALLWR